MAANSPVALMTRCCSKTSACWCKSMPATIPIRNQTPPRLGRGARVQVCLTKPQPHHRDSRHWLQVYHRQCKEAIWIARKKALQEFVDKGVYETQALLLYIWQSKPSLWMRFHTVKLSTVEPPVWWVVAQEAQTRKTMQLEKLVRMMEDQEDAALAARGLTGTNRPSAAAGGG
jgi:hypothetical protein